MGVTATTEAPVAQLCGETGGPRGLKRLWPVASVVESAPDGPLGARRRSPPCVTFANGLILLPPPVSLPKRSTLVCCVWYHWTEQRLIPSSLTALDTFLTRQTTIFPRRTWYAVAQHTVACFVGQPSSSSSSSSMSRRVIEPQTGRVCPRRRRVPGLHVGPSRLSNFAMYKEAGKQADGSGRNPMNPSPPPPSPEEVC